MENTPTQPVNPQPTPPVQKTAQVPASSAPTKSPVQSAPTNAAKPGVVATVKSTSSAGKKFIIGCFGAIGCSLFLFIAVIFGFLAFGSTSSPIFGFLGVAPSEVYNVIFSITNLIFLVLVFLTFIFVVVGIFKRITARKDDMPAKRSGNIFIFFATVIMIFFIVAWIMAYFYLVGKRTTGPVRDPIITTPTQTINISAPVTITFDGSKALAGRTDLQVLSYEWDFDDGAKARGDKQTHTFTELGNFKVSLTITVKNRTTAKEESVVFTRDVTIDNVLAKVVIKTDSTSGPAPLTVHFDGSNTSSPNGEITEYAWDLDGNGEFDDSTDAETDYTYEKIDAYKVKLRVTDSSGQTSEGTVTIDATAPDDPVPVVTIDGVEGTNLTAGVAYTFSGVDSTSPKGKVEKYGWELSDGTTSQTRTLKHVFTEVGEYDVILKITDSTKRTAAKTIKYTVLPADAAPTLSVTSEPKAVEDVIKGDIPLTVSFDASQSTDTNDSIVEYRWDFDGDGKVDDSNAITNYTFNKTGTYTVKVTAIDSTDAQSSMTFKVVATQKGISADIKATPDSGAAPLKVSFDASGSSYPEGRIVSYEWDFGDGSKPRIDAAKVSYQYTRIGTFTAKVTAITNDNQRASITTSISVRPVSLSACFDPSIESGNAPLSITFDSLCSTGTIIRYTWNFGGLKRSNERKPSFTFSKAGSYDVTLEVRDTQNVIDTFTKTITVK